jgi:hypothetical protein
MSEYIDRDAALVALQDSDLFNTTERQLRAIRELPAADVAEVRHGRWIHHEDGVFTCSECGNAESNDSYYCRLCGAKMDGAAE